MDYVPTVEKKEHFYTIKIYARKQDIARLCQVEALA